VALPTRGSGLSPADRGSELVLVLSKAAAARVRLLTGVEERATRASAPRSPAAGSWRTARLASETLLASTSATVRAFPVSAALDALVGNL